MGLFKKEKQPAQKTSFAPRKSDPKFLLGLMCLTAALLSFVSFWHYEPGQSQWVTTAALNEQGHLTTPNLVGKLGATMAFWGLYTVGLSIWLLPLFFLGSAYALLFGLAHTLRFWKFAAFGLSIFSVSGLLTMFEAHLWGSGVTSNYYPYGFGGMLGTFLYTDLMASNLGAFGSSLLLIVIASVTTVFVFLPYETPGKAFEAFFNYLKAASQPLGSLRKPEEKAKPEGPSLFKQLMMNLVERTAVKPQPVVVPLEPEVPQASAVPPPPAPVPQKKSLGVLRKKEPQVAQAQTEPLKVVATEKVKKVKATIPVRKGNYIFPKIDLLHEAPPVLADSAEDHLETAQSLVQTLKEFNIDVVPGEVHTGPVITRYEITPASGVRVEKIVNLDKNIAMSLRALSVRILAPVPGKGCVGVEIPNKRPSQVCLRDIIESTAWANSKAEIPVVLGKEVTGRPLVADLTKMPHLLIAGATGAGKTVCINAIIASLLYHSSPEDLRFLMIDPKIVEMQIYNALPHMLIPVVTDPKKVPGALKWLIAEMERRYQVFAKVGVRNVAGFNAKILKNREEKAKAAELDAELSPEERAAVSSIEVPRDVEVDVPETKMPYIVCIIDELADLMMVAPADIETGIARLAQLARAAGIHLVIATQRPSVNVITGVIKANLPCRIAFKVSSKVDSRTILDGGGADQLIGRGDMLFTPPGNAALMRAQGALVSDEEIHDIVEFLKQNGPPQFSEHIQRQVDSGGEGEDGIEGDWDDELVPKAIGVLRSTKRASTSMLQRRLRIGYNRAARIMEILEDEGFVGPDNGAQPREILKDLDLV